MRTKTGTGSNPGRSGVSGSGSSDAGLDSNQVQGLAPCSTAETELWPLFRIDRDARLVVLVDHSMDQIANGGLWASTASRTAVKHSKVVAFPLDFPKVHVAASLMVRVKLEAVGIIVAQAVGVHIAIALALRLAKTL